MMVNPRIATSLLICITLFSCSPPERRSHTRDALSLEAISIQPGQRGFFLSDKAGAFLISGGQGGRHTLSFEWAVRGWEILRGMDVVLGEQRLTAQDIESVRVYPHKVAVGFRPRAVVTLHLVDGASLPGSGYHAMVVEVSSDVVGNIAVEPAAEKSFRSGSASRQGVAVWNSADASIALYGGHGGVARERGVVVPQSRSARFLIVVGPEAHTLAEGLYGSVDAFLASRAARFLTLLEGSYCRTSDPRLSLAIQWAKLTLDALVVERDDTIAVAGIPWDGSLQTRDIAQGIATYGITTGKHGTTAAVLRHAVRWQDTVSGRPTTGWLATAVKNGIPSYSGADVTPWFFVTMYEYIQHSNDTVLAREMYPALKRSLGGTAAVDSHNLLLHGEYQTWMGSGRDRVARGNRAIEVQHFWYYQQLIGSFVASFVGDTSNARLWGQGAVRTAASINKLFVDPETSQVYDHLTPTGVGSGDVRPNVLIALETIESEDVRAAMINLACSILVRPFGVATLATTNPTSSAAHTSRFNGAVHPWLTASATYWLTRSNREPLAFSLTDILVEEILDRGMVGGIPEVYHESIDGARTSAGYDVSFAAVAEFLRTIYQDYFGVKLDESSRVINIQPKLPPSVRFVDLTVRAGVSPLRLVYDHGDEYSRLVIEAPGRRTPLRSRLIWILDNGDAWRSTVDIPPGADVTIAFGDDDMLVYVDEDEVQPQSKMKLVGFARK